MVNLKHKLCDLLGTFLLWFGFISFIITLFVLPISINLYFGHRNDPTEQDILKTVIEAKEWCQNKSEVPESVCSIFNSIMEKEGDLTLCQTPCSFLNRTEALNCIQECKLTWSTVNDVKEKSTSDAKKESYLILLIFTFICSGYIGIILIVIICTGFIELIKFICKSVRDVSTTEIELEMQV